MNIDYIKQIEGNEAVLDKYVEAVFAGTCKAAREYPHPLQLRGYENCWEKPLIFYFLQQPFVLARAAEFFEKLRKLSARGFREFSYQLQLWIEATIQQPFFSTTKDRNHVTTVVLRPDADRASVNPDHLKFLCYVAICHLKYGLSFEFITANLYFGMATALGSDEVEKLKKHGSGTLPKALTEYKDARVSCVANDAFATIKIAVKQEAAESYEQALKFLNALLQTDFPRSYAIEFSSKEKTYLPIKGLPKKGVHALFANAVRYPELHPLLAEYARQAMRPNEWYNNLSDEECAMPGTFAVFALGLVGEQYFDLVQQYMQTVDDEHQSIQQQFTPVFVAQYGVTAQSLPVIISAILSAQAHKPYKVLAEQFGTRPALELLLAARSTILGYLHDENDEEQPDDPEGLADYAWESVLYTIFGPAKNYPKLLKSASDELRPLVAALFAKPAPTA